MTEYGDFIESALREAMLIADRSFGKVTGSVKADDNNQVLTETDIEVGKLLVGRVQKMFPHHNVIDEEAGIIDNGSRFTWVIDPIDGTSNFANGIPTYGIMIGLLDGETPIAGGVALPPQHELYLAAKGHGAVCNGQPIHVSSESNLLNALVAYGIDGHQENPDMTHQEAVLLGNIVLSVRNVRTSNSVLDQMRVASGGYGASLNRTSKIWDNVAQQIIIEEAGGIYTDFHGQPIDYSSPLTKANLTFSFCAGAPALHQQLQTTIHAT